MASAEFFNDNSVLERLPSEGVAGPVIHFHKEYDLPWGMLSNFFPAPIKMPVSDSYGSAAAGSSSTTTSATGASSSASASPSSSKPPRLLVYPTNEHYFQSQKFSGDANNEELMERIRNAETPGLAAEIGKSRANKIRSDWDDFKEVVMFDALVAKFSQHPILLHGLMLTKFTFLNERSHRDRYWGDGGNQSGQNRLGVLLMQLRDAFLRVGGGVSTAKSGQHRSMVYQSRSDKCDQLLSEELDISRLAVVDAWLEKGQRPFFPTKYVARRVTVSDPPKIRLVNF